MLEKKGLSPISDNKKTHTHKQRAESLFTLGLFTDKQIYI